MQFNNNNGILNQIKINHHATISPGFYFTYFNLYLVYIGIKKSKPLPTPIIRVDTINISTGQELILKFYNEKEEMVLQFQSEDYILENQKPGSGIWYKGENFEVRGKGKEITVYQDGKLLFKK
ncbi:MliC family protein [Tenacibaculum sp. SG-28]|uniref:MliC family protein n=1 Tax=Tenacibaculum sp. SG-28 TaxID=754426 RepID=UPI000CF57004|nr:MliC family protein [Tenacibaculum sp. SG-28]PQJ22773.1 hypothetical protein BSU00_00150 [Tenacibaculum sp. SG-28]